MEVLRQGSPIVSVYGMNFDVLVRQRHVEWRLKYISETRQGEQDRLCQYN